MQASCLLKILIQIKLQLQEQDLLLFLLIRVLLQGTCLICHLKGHQLCNHHKLLTNLKWEWPLLKLDHLLEANKGIKLLSLQVAVVEVLTLRTS